MSLVTTCPDCGTLFKVKPEHLAAHRGDVRCGNCNFIFNALDHLAETLTQEEPTVEQAPEELLETPVEFSATAELEGTAEEVADEPAPQGEVDFVLETDSTQATALQEANLAQQNSENEAGTLPFNLEASVTPEPVPETEHQGITSEYTPKIRLESLDSKPERYSSVWRIGVLVLLLLVAVLGQSIYFLRTQIATQLPPVKPYLVRFCDIVGCVVDLPRQSDLFVIDDSDLRQDVEHEDVIVLSTTIINHASFAQAYPLLEVTLTDVDERAVLRRVFQPQEYLPKDTEAKAGIPAGGETLVRLHLATGGVKVAGYRVYVMYH